MACSVPAHLRLSKLSDRQMRQDQKLIMTPWQRKRSPDVT